MLCPSLDHRVVGRRQSIGLKGIGVSLVIYVIFVLIGMIVGAGMDDDAFWFVGGMLGFLLARSIRLAQQVARLQDKVDRLAARQSTLSAPSQPLGKASDAVTHQPVPDLAETADERAAGTAAEVEAKRAARLKAARIAAREEDLLERVSADKESAPRPAEPAPTASEVPAPANAGSSPGYQSPPPPTAPPEPGLLERGLRQVWGFLTGGNPMVRVGALISLVGVAFLLRYLAERVTVPPGFRVSMIAAAGVVMILAGLRLRHRRPGFALPFQGAGVGILYLTCFASLRLYQLIPASLTFVLLLAIVGLTIVLAIAQNSLVLAVIGVVGGFVAPVLASTGTGSHVQLFGFYLLLNIAIAVIAWFRSWRMLNWVGFIFTFGIASLWGNQYYDPEFFATTEPFLIAHVALYIVIAIFFASKQPLHLKGLVDGTIIFGTPLVGFTLQSLLLKNDAHALAISSAAFGGTYLMLWGVLRARDRQGYRLLSQCFLALGGVFLTLAIPLAFDGRVTSAMWSLEGAAIVWTGIRQTSTWRRLAGYALMVLGSIAFLVDFNETVDGTVFLNANFVGVAIIAMVFVYIGGQAHRQLGGRGLVAGSMVTYGVLWWTIGGIAEIDHHLVRPQEGTITIVYLVTSAVVLAFLAARWSFSVLRVLSAIVALAAGLVYWIVLDQSSPELALSGRNAGTALLVLAGLLATAQLGRNTRFDIPSLWPSVLAGFGVVHWLAAIRADVLLRSLAEPEAWFVLLASLSLVGFFWLHRLLRWPLWRWAAEVHIFGFVLTLLAAMDLGQRLMVGVGWLAWPFAAAACYWLLRLREPDAADRVEVLHMLALHGLLGLLTFDLYHGVRAAKPALELANAALGLLPALGIIGLRSPLARRLWPFCRDDVYRGWWLTPALVWLTGWCLWVATVQPHPPSPYLPVLNLLELAVVAAIVAVAITLSRIPMALEATRMVQLGLAGLGFYWINAALLRALHVYLNIPWAVESLWGSFTVQASVTALWTGSAFVAMILGARWARRPLWLAGAVMMGMAVVKLLIVDLDGTGTLARIGACFVVAAGLFAAGYLAPRPPPPATPSVTADASGVDLR